MSFKPSRTRDERKNASLYTPENELRLQLEQQALEKRRQKTIEALKEKEEILNHYANSKLPAGESGTELDNFLSQKRQELDFLNKQLEAIGTGPNNKQTETREIKRKEPPTQIFYDNFLKKDENIGSQGRLASKEELDREKRLKLREEERIRRLMGSKESAYDSNKPYLPQVFPENRAQEKQEQENQILQMYRKQQSGVLLDTNLKQEEKRTEPTIVETKQQTEKYDPLPPVIVRKSSERFNAGDFANLKREEQLTRKPTSELEGRDYISTNKSPQGLKDMPTSQSSNEVGNRGGNLSRMNTKEQGEKVNQGNNLFGRLGSQGSLSEAEKKKKYKEELDMLVKQKQEIAAKESKDEPKRAWSRGNRENLQSAQNEKNQGNREMQRFSSFDTEREKDDRNIYKPVIVDRSAQEREEKKQKYAEELMKDIAARERERERVKQEERGQVYRGLSKIDNLEQDFGQKKGFEELGNNYPKENIKRGGGLQNIMAGRDDNQAELEKRKKYKETLDAQVAEKRRIQSAKQEPKQQFSQEKPGVEKEGFENFERFERFEKVEIKSNETEQIKRVENKDNGFFLHKAEDDEKQRAQMRNLQKQKMADDLKKQMEEKEEQKKREKKQRAEEEQREKERIEREIEKEKVQQQEELQKKKQTRARIEENNVQKSPRTKTSNQQQSYDDNNVMKMKPFSKETGDIFERSQIDKKELSQGKNEEIQENYYFSKNEPQGQYPHYNSEFNPNIPSQGTYNPNRQIDTINNGGYPLMSPAFNNNPAFQFQPFQIGYYGQGMPMPLPMPTQGQYGFGVAGNIYQEMANYHQIMQQLLEEKIKIEKLALEEQRLFEEYQDKIKEMKLEKAQYEQESKKIMQILNNEMPATPSMIGKNTIDPLNKLAALGNSYLPALIDLKNMKASHINNYNKLLAQSKQSYVANLNAHQPQKTKGFLDPNQGASALQDTLVSEAFDEDGLLRQSLPSNEQQHHLSKTQFQKSFLKDFEAFQKATKDLGLENGINLEEYSLLMFNKGLQASNSLGFSGTLPMISELKPIEGEDHETMREFQENQNPWGQKEISNFLSTRMSVVKIESSISQIPPAGSGVYQKNLELSSKGPSGISKKESINLGASSNENQERPSEFKEEEYIYNEYYQNPSIQQFLQRTLEKAAKNNDYEAEKKMTEPKPEQVGQLGKVAKEEEEYNQEDFENFTGSEDEDHHHHKKLISGLENKEKAKTMIEQREDKGSVEQIISIKDYNTKQKADTYGYKKMGSSEKSSDSISPSRPNTQERRYKAPKTLDPFAKAVKNDVRSSIEEKKDIFRISTNRSKEIQSYNKPEVKNIKGSNDQYKNDLFEEKEPFDKNSYKNKNESVKKNGELIYGKNNDEYVEENIENDIDEEIKEEENLYKHQERSNFELNKDKPKEKSRKQWDKPEVKPEDDQRNKMLFNRLQNLLDDWEDNKEKYEGTIKEVSEEEDHHTETVKTNQFQGLFKPLSQTKNSSNRYLRNEDR